MGSRYASRVACLRVEHLLWSTATSRLAGVDEVGRGAWAGPVVACAVVLPRERALLRPLIALIVPTAGPRRASPLRLGERSPATVRDSKKLLAEQRAAAASVIHDVALDVGVGTVPAGLVDDLGLSAAGQLAFWRAVSALVQPPDCILVDGFPLWSQAIPQISMPQGDQHCLSVAAASIVAKVARDGMMTSLAADMPDYGWDRNVGYGTPEHRDALARLGPSPQHRRSFDPVAAAMAI